MARIERHVNELRADADLMLAAHSIDEIGAVVDTLRRNFIDETRRIAMEIFREPLTQDPLWMDCACEWGMEVAFGDLAERRLRTWFEDTRPDLEEALDEQVNALWERVVIAPLMELGEENAPEQSSALGGGTGGISSSMATD